MFRKSDFGLKVIFGPVSDGSVHPIALYPFEGKTMFYENPNCRSAVRTADNSVMALHHVSRHVAGLQFHPKSIGTECGMKIIQNSLRLTAGRC